MFQGPLGGSPFLQFLVEGQPLGIFVPDEALETRSRSARSIVRLPSRMLVP